MFAIENNADGSTSIEWTGPVKPGPVGEGWRVFVAFWEGARKSVFHRQVRTQDLKAVQRFKEFARTKQWKDSNSTG